MKLLDIILITLAGLSLYLLSEDVSRTVFSNTNAWIPNVFSDSVSWQPGAVFHTVLSAIVSGLFLARFAPQPVLIAFLIGLTVEMSALYPIIEANGLQTTFSLLTSSWQTTQKYLQAIILLPLISYFLYLMKRPNREHEVIQNDDRRY